MTDWTPAMVDERLVEAAAVLRRLPMPRARVLQRLAPHGRRVQRPCRSDAGVDAFAAAVGHCHQPDGGRAAVAHLARA